MRRPEPPPGPCTATGAAANGQMMLVPGQPSLPDHHGEVREPQRLGFLGRRRKGVGKLGGTLERLELIVDCRGGRAGGAAQAKGRKGRLLCQWHTRDTAPSSTERRHHLQPSDDRQTVRRNKWCRHKRQLLPSSLVEGREGGGERPARGACTGVVVCKTALVPPSLPPFPSLLKKSHAAAQYNHRSPGQAHKLGYQGEGWIQAVTAPAGVADVPSDLAGGPLALQSGGRNDGHGGVDAGGAVLPLDALCRLRVGGREDDQKTGTGGVAPVVAGGDGPGLGIQVELDPAALGGTLLGRCAGRPAMQGPGAR